PRQTSPCPLAFLARPPGLGRRSRFGRPPDKGRQPTPLGHHLEPGAGGTLPQDIIGPEVRITPWQWRHRLGLPEEIPLGQAGRGSADDHRPWRGEILEPCRQRQSTPDRQWIVPATTTLADDDRSGMDPNAHGARPCGSGRGLLLERLDQAQPGPNTALDIVFMRLWMPEIRHQSVSQIMRDIPLKAVDD